MKLYILTSTLNFHSIMATESCSPSACYAQRGFGDSYFYVAGSFAKKNSIILFSKYPKCVMPVTEEEQYSLVIEIDTEKTANFEFEKVGRRNDVVIYQTSKTIYLNPMGCKLLFESNAIRELILSRAKVRSLDAKMLFYSKAESFALPQTESFAYSKEYIESYSDVEFDDENLLRDKKINKCKGFLYAYVIGANTSPGEGVSNMQQVLKELSNLIHARIINNDFSLHTEKIDELQKQFETEARKYDIVTKKLSESANRLNSSTIEMLQKELVRLGVWEELACKIFSLPSLSDIYSSEQWDNIETKMTQFITSVSSAANNRLIVDDIPAIHEYEPPVVHLSASNQEIEIYTAWIKLLLNPECNLKGFFANKLSFLKNLGIAAKGIMGDEAFANSPERAYYNGLIKNIREAEDFDLSSLNSMVWQSLAICAKATNPDVDALYSLMTSCAVEDYCCAVAMWGAMCGYADMPKTFFNRIVEGVSIQDAYEYSISIGKRIHGFESIALSTLIFQSQTASEPASYQEQIAQNSLEDIVHNHLKEYEKERNGKKMSKSHRESIEKALSITSDGTVLSFLMKLNDFPGFTRRTQTSFWTYLKDRVCPEYDEITTAKPANKSTMKKQNSPGLFDTITDGIKSGIENIKGTIPNVTDAIFGTSNSSKEETTFQQTSKEVSLSMDFINDTNVLTYIETLSYLKPYMNDIKQNVIFIQKGYQPGGQYAKGGRQESDPSNSQVIKHLGNLIKKVHAGQPVPEDVVNMLKHDLLVRYNVR